MNLSRALSLDIDKDHDAGLDLLPLDDLRGPLNEDDIAFLEAWVDFTVDSDHQYKETKLSYEGDIEVRPETLVLATRKFALIQRLALLKSDDLPSGPDYKTYGNAVFSPRPSKKALFSETHFSFNPLFGAPFEDAHDVNSNEEDDEAPLLRRLHQEHLSYEYEALMRADMRDLEAHGLIHWTPDELVDAALARDFNDFNDDGNGSDIHEPHSPITPRFDDCSPRGDCNSCRSDSNGGPDGIPIQRRNPAHPPRTKPPSPLAAVVSLTAPEYEVAGEEVAEGGEVCPSPGTPAARCTPLSYRRVSTPPGNAVAEVERPMEDNGGGRAVAAAATATAAVAASVPAPGNDDGNPTNNDVGLAAAAEEGRAAAAAAAAAAGAVVAAATKGDSDDVADDDAAWRRLLDGMPELPYEYEALMRADMRDLEEFNLIYWTPDELVEAALTRDLCQQPPAATDPWVTRDNCNPEKPSCLTSTAIDAQRCHDGIDVKKPTPESGEGDFWWLGDSGWYGSGSGSGSAIMARSFCCTAPKTSEWSSTLALLGAPCLSVPTDFCSTPVRPSTPDGNVTVTPPRSFPRAPPSSSVAAEVTVAAAAAAAAARTVAWMMASGTPAIKGSETYSADGRGNGANESDLPDGGGGGGGGREVGNSSADGDGSRVKVQNDGYGNGGKVDVDEDDAAWHRFLGTLDEMPYEYEALMRADMRDLEEFNLIYWTPDELVEAALARECAVVF
ncbi:hypothetical protein VOLCADRAFT_98145 [Volvox carteri f. nagariensis]|uniref:Uncharacterized protein n=1 Tax=Volvox carteri f. nagariensis TaxID=3068 RepID=D8UEK1_VOLCA|nr:uncharacterized protein VOLCADRAFT_98145 [Volvox carteri f. nagariensis]EFJ41897.1 hypothetical protein VOLCADRAFT_98145 [Volvox carteri f. nagariensis]|eukprot:XP_002957095.1 hypothetical protein VOLCADRAFT_98145 [Volvox carteri f. nagariensis]